MDTQDGDGRCYWLGRRYWHYFFDREYVAIMGILIYQSFLFERGVERQQSYSWGIYDAVTKTLTYSWDIYAAIAKTLTYEWMIGSYVTKDLTYSWAIYQYMAKDLTYSWDILSNLSKIDYVFYSVQRQRAVSGREGTSTRGNVR